MKNMEKSTFMQTYSQASATEVSGENLIKHTSMYV